MPPSGLLIAIEGGGTRTQAALFDLTGELLATAQSGPVNVNFTTPEQARAAVEEAVAAVLRAAGAIPTEVTQVAYALVSTPEVALHALQRACPQAERKPYGEGQVVFARAGHYRPHGVAIVAGTGTSAWAMRQDDGRQMALGGWGSLLGDEGSAYAVGLMGLRAAAKAWEGREAPTVLIEAVREHFGLRDPDFKKALIRLAYRKPLSRTEIAGFARAVTRAAAEGDAVARRVVNKVAHDLAELGLQTIRQLFSPREALVVVAAGGLLNAGEPILSPLHQRLRAEYPAATLQIGTEEPAVALGRLALYDISSRGEVSPC